MDKVAELVKQKNSVVLYIPIDNSDREVSVLGWFDNIQNCNSWKQEENDQAYNLLLNCMKLCQSSSNYHILVDIYNSDAIANELFLLKWKEITRSFIVQQSTRPSDSCFHDFRGSFTGADPCQIIFSSIRSENNTVSLIDYHVLERTNVELLSKLKGMQVYSGSIKAKPSNVGIFLLLSSLVSTFRINSVSMLCEGGVSKVKVENSGGFGGLWGDDMLSPGSLRSRMVSGQVESANMFEKFLFEPEKSALYNFEATLATNSLLLSNPALSQSNFISYPIRDNAVSIKESSTVPVSSVSVSNISTFLPVKDESTSSGWHYTEVTPPRLCGKIAENYYQYMMQLHAKGIPEVHYDKSFEFCSKAVALRASYLESLSELRWKYNVFDVSESDIEVLQGNLSQKAYRTTASNPRESLSVDTRSPDAVGQYELSSHDSRSIGGKFKYDSEVSSMNQEEEDTLLAIGALSSLASSKDTNLASAPVKDAQQHAFGSYRNYGPHSTKMRKLNEEGIIGKYFRKSNHKVALVAPNTIVVAAQSAGLLPEMNIDSYLSQMPILSDVPSKPVENWLPSCSLVRQSNSLCENGGNVAASVIQNATSICEDKSERPARSDQKIDNVASMPLQLKQVDGKDQLSYIKSLLREEILASCSANIGSPQAGVLNAAVHKLCHHSVTAIVKRVMYSMDYSEDNIEQHHVTYDHLYRCGGFLMKHIVSKRSPITLQDVLAIFSEYSIAYASLRKEDPRRIAAICMTILTLDALNLPKYPNIDVLVENYPEFRRYSASELVLLAENANLFACSLVFVSPRSNKGILLGIIPRLAEGPHVKYVTGGGASRATMDRVIIFEKEGNICAKKRDSSHGKCLPNNGNKIKRGLTVESDLSEDSGEVEN